jgi:hypothetical protein
MRRDIPQCLDQTRLDGIIQGFSAITKVAMPTVRFYPRRRGKSFVDNVPRLARTCASSGVWRRHGGVMRYGLETPAGITG